MSKLSMEWGDNDVIILRKKRGKITFDEVMRFMHEREQLNCFDGDLAMYAFRISSQRDMYSYLDDFLEPDGDSVELQIIQDDSKCPICSNTVYLQYCPDCGRKLFGSEV